VDQPDALIGGPGADFSRAENLPRRSGAHRRLPGRPGPSGGVL